jgi:enterochelin esterase-like enzyme
MAFRKRLFTLLGISFLLTACVMIGRSEKRARMATALPSPTDTPLSALGRPTGTPAPLHGESPAPSSVLSCPEREGVWHTETVSSSINGSSAAFSVYVPPCYSADEQVRYPSIILFHGLGRTPDQWRDLGLEITLDQLIVSGRIPPVLVVMPHVAGEDSDDAVFLADVLPAVDGRFRTLADRGHRAIGGVSRGAEWALRLALRRADLFSAVGVHSISPSPNALADIYLWAESVPETLWPRAYFDAGYSDPQLQQMQGILQAFDLLKRPYEKRIPPGDHSDAYWSGQLREYLLWYTGEWLNANAPA